MKVQLQRGPPGHQRPQLFRGPVDSDLVFGERLHVGGLAAATTVRGQNGRVK